MLRQDSNELYCILVEQLIRNEFRTAQSIIKILTKIRIRTDLHFSEINNVLWKDNKTRLIYSLKVVIEDYMSNYE